MIDEYELLVQKRVQLERELNKEALIEEEKRKIAELEAKLHQAEHKEDKKRKLIEELRKLKDAWEQYKLKDTGLHL